MTTILCDTDDRRRQAKVDHDAVIDLQWRSMRDNLVFYAIPEKVNESCDATLKQFFVDELGVTEDVEIARAHRMGKQETGKTRPIVAKFHRYQQRETIRLAGPRFAVVSVSASANKYQRNGRSDKNRYFLSSRMQNDKGKGRVLLATSFLWKGAS